MSQPVPPVPPVPKDQIEQWIADLVPGKTFVDIGGIGVNASNERVTFAARAGARRAAMADIRPFSYYEWTLFNEKCAQAGVTDIHRYEHVDITSPTLGESLPTFDVVHCTGIFYHLPSPISAFDTLRQVVGRYLIVNTVTLPERISNEQGTMEHKGNVALLLAGLSTDERAILDAHYQAKFGWTLAEIAPPLDQQQGAKMPFFTDGKLSCWPYWWLMTDACFRSVIRLMGFTIREEYKWEDHCLFCLCERS